MARHIIELRFFRLLIGGTLLAVALNPVGLCSAQTPCHRAQIVKAAIKKITDSGIFPDDCGFLRRIAFVESKDGRDLPKNPNGGIWQIDPIGFNDTKATSNHSKLQRKLDAVNVTFAINWYKVKYAQLENNPFLSALAARILLSNKEPPIPKGIREQAAYWKEHYNTPAGAGTAQKFIDDIIFLEKQHYK